MKIKKIISLLLVFTIILSSTITTFAESDLQEFNSEFTVEDVKALEPYISVVDGQFEMDVKQAEEDGVNKKLIDGQLEFFKFINKKADEGTLKIYSDLHIEEKNNDNLELVFMNILLTSHTSDCGGGITTESEIHWWGHSRYLCDCQSKIYAAELHSVSTAAGGFAIVSAWFGGGLTLPAGMTASYFEYFSARVTANNYGHGVYVETTWLLLFDITPQS